eukprot:scaffold7720_cov149-Amphora_coffeaeformis.AAC.7
MYVSATKGLLFDLFDAVRNGVDGWLTGGGFVPRASRRPSRSQEVPLLPKKREREQKRGENAPAFRRLSFRPFFWIQKGFSFL